METRLLYRQPLVTAALPLEALQNMIRSHRFTIERSVSGLASFFVERRRSRISAGLVAMIAVLLYCRAVTGEEKRFGEPVLQNYLKQLEALQPPIPEDRKSVLQAAAAEIRREHAETGAVDLVFVCTHNSRRSQMAQVWAAIAVERYGLNGVRSFSCGTEATACNARTIAALERAGLAFTQLGEAANPVYSLVREAGLPDLHLFSKAFDHPSLPRKEFMAMMCCDEADKNCPNILGARGRIPLWYNDPKISDDGPDEASVYDARCYQIAAEMFALIKMVADDR